MIPVPDEWINNTTFQRRYDLMGVTGHIYEYANGLTEEIRVADVGCSFGVALAECQACLKGKGIKMHTIGIDGSPNVKTKASKHLSDFIPDYVTEVNKERVGECDIVICVNTVRYVDIPYWYEVIKKCLEFLKHDGILITGINHSEGLALKTESFFQGTSPPGMLCPRRGLRGLVERLRLKRAPKDTRAMKRKDASRYTEMLHEEWNRLSQKQKQQREAKIRRKKILYGNISDLLKFWAGATNNMICKRAS